MTGAFMTISRPRWMLLRLNPAACALLLVIAGRSTADGTAQTEGSQLQTASDVLDLTH